MAFINSRRSILFGAAVLFVLTLILSTCNIPMGLGEPIDWEPPFLTLDGASVRYVNNNTILTGTVTDNGKVDRVILRDTVSGNVLFTAALLPNDRWEIVLKFDQSRNGDKILGQVIAYDSFGNSGDLSMASITLYVDMGPPLIEDIWIQRTEVRKADLERYNVLKALETSDPNREKIGNVNRYQNGVFWIDARIAENETRINDKILRTYIYDESRPNTPIFPNGTEKDISSTTYNPRFTFDETEILDYGARIFGPSYITNYNNNGARYYYKIIIVAEDSAQNRNIVSEQDYFCMWKTADMPRGILDDPSGEMVEPIALPKGSSVPLVFFDDDALEYAFAALFTKAQWDGTRPIASGVSIQGANNEAKLNFLSARFIAGTPTYDWNYDKHTSDAKVIGNLVQGGGTMDERYHDVLIGNDNNDYDEYRLVTVVRDKKLTPHGDTVNIYNPLTATRVWELNVIDENAPLIVFDKSDTPEGGCPEENTFPKLKDASGNVGSGGKYFEIVGYTLRENTTGTEGTITTPNLNTGNRVTYFRMAWIPFGMPGGADSHVKAVREALEKRNPVNTDFPAGVQWWTLRDESLSINRMTGDKNTKISTGMYRQQSFRKKFDVTGGADDLNAQLGKNYNNFMYNGQLENETKLFLFYAEDNMGHVTHSQLYLLGQKSPPDITVYDLTDRRINFTPLPPDIKSYIPGNSPDGTITDAVRRAYQTQLDAYNREASTYSTISTEANKPPPPQLTEMLGLQAFPRSTTTSYWVTAQGTGNIALKSIEMEDVTTSVTSRGNIGNFNAATATLSYTEFHPEVTSKTFRFTATDELGNTKSIQRTVMITNAALLTEITTKTQNGEYGIGTEIILEARFSAMVQWKGANKPLLNVRYLKNGVSTQIEIPTSTPADNPFLFLAFPVTVDINDGGMLETLYNLPAGGNKEPITLPAGTTIIDSERKDDAFLPGYAAGFSWITVTNSLQSNRTIQLNGTRPRSDGIITIGGKTAYTPGEWYFKKGETIELTLSSQNNTTNNLILPGALANGSAKPRIEFSVGGQTHYAEWQRSANNGQSMVFRVLADGLPDGVITGLKLNKDQGNVVNGVGNKLINTLDTNEVTNLALNGQIWIDQTPPSMPVPQLNNLAPTALYNADPVLTIGEPSNEPQGIARKEYSLNNGLEWVTFPNGRTNWTANINTTSLSIYSGDWIMRTRYVDKAGNEGAMSSDPFSVNSNFPELKLITAVQPNGIYTENTGRNSLEFRLTFADTVRTETLGDVTITLSNRSASVTTTQTVTLTATAQATLSNTISFKWDPISGKEMLDGLYVSAVKFTGLRDKYGNAGGEGTATTGNSYRITITRGTNTHICENLDGGKLIVDCIAPEFSSSVPSLNANTVTTPAANSVMNLPRTNTTNYNRVITLTFNEAVQAGSGTIIIKPHGNYYIPPVFENDTYYLLVRTGARSPTPQSGYTKITGFYDVYNATPTGMRTNLTKGTSMTKLELDARTGQSAGPYIRMTQGLKTGRGYTGNYNNSMTLANSNNQFDNGTYSGPNVNRTQNFMVPDTTTKWVLDYCYSIDGNNNSQIVSSTGTNPSPADPNPVVPAIRTALTAAKYRWQEMDVTSSAITYSGDRKTVTITLPEPLEDGLQWDLCYKAGTFTDLAGHGAPELNYTAGGAILDNNGTWFVSNGAQVPVIRVNRKSFDARTGNWATVYPDAGANNPTNNQYYAVPTDRVGPGGWGINDFNRVYFRIETETPNATISYRRILGSASVQGGATIGSVYIATGTNAWAAVPNGGGTNLLTANWYDAYNTSATRGRMVRPNLIRRASNTNSWSVIDENNITTTRSFVGNHSGLRSYNRDALETEITPVGTMNQLTTTEAPTNSSVSSGSALYFDYEPTEASKNYVVAQATVAYGATANQSVRRGYEGVYRSVVAILSGNDGNPLFVEGSNVKNGMPSIAGFPVQDAAESGDNRYIKYFYNAGQNTGTDTSRKFYWVSTEIVSEWYFIKFGNGNRHMSSGDVNNYLICGYGDLTFAFRPTGY